MTPHIWRIILKPLPNWKSRYGWVCLSTLIGGFSLVAIYIDSNGCGAMIGFTVVTATFTWMGLYYARHIFGLDEMPEPLAYGKMMQWYGAVFLAFFIVSGVAMTLVASAGAVANCLQFAS